MKQKEERMDQCFSVFNQHVNKADKRADKEFIAQYGQPAFNCHITPRHKEGIMSIFNRKPNKYTLAWVTLVTAYVNENRK